MFNILLIEDDEVDVIAVQRMFKKNQVINPLYLAASGLDALAMLHSTNRQSPAFKENLLILLDYYLPIMNGLEFLAELQLHPDFREIPVIICITYEEMKIHAETACLNVLGYLEKPIIFSELSKILKCDWEQLQKVGQGITSLNFEGQKII